MDGLSTFALILSKNPTRIFGASHWQLTAFVRSTQASDSMSCDGGRNILARAQCLQRCDCHRLQCRNVLDLGAYLLQTAIVIMHLSRAGVDSNELSVMMAIQVLVLWIKVQYYAR